MVSCPFLGITYKFYFCISVAGSFSRSMWGIIPDALLQLLGVYCLTPLIPLTLRLLRVFSIDFVSWAAKLALGLSVRGRLAIRDGNLDT